ncbi:MAG: glucuronosyltransferase [Rhodobacteraceae bacterium]|nr:glucuronosyltransferase [Paracoccaceae bacterium]
MLPFDRLIRRMDEWAAEADGEEIVAQIGNGAFAPRHMRWMRRLERTAFDDTVRRARLVVAHAGVGSIMTARSFGRPIVVLPRRRRLGEHTSDHQLETAAWMHERPGIYVAETEVELGARIAQALAAPEADAPAGGASPALLSRLSNFIQQSPIT